MRHNADIKLGYECNDHCIHCVVDELRDIAIKTKRKRDTKEYLKEIDESKKAGYNSITVTGGEPTIRPDFIEILHYIKDNELCCEVQSNGRKFKDLELAKKATPLVNNFIIALHGPTEEIHDKVTETKGSFNETIEGIKNLIKTNAKRITGKIVLSHINYKQVFETLKLYEKLGVNFVVVSFPHSSGASDYIKRVAPYYKDIKPYIEECLDYYNNVENFHLIVEDIMPCALSKEYPIIHFYEFFQAFKKKRRLSTLSDSRRDWNNLRKSIKRKHEKCTKCVFNNWCDGYWKEYVDERGFDEFEPIEKADFKILFKYDATYFENKNLP